MQRQRLRLALCSTPTSQWFCSPTLPTLQGSGSAANHHLAATAVASAAATASMHLAEATTIMAVLAAVVVALTACCSRRQNLLQPLGAAAILAPPHSITPAVVAVVAARAVARSGCRRSNNTTAGGWDSPSAALRGAPSCLVRVQVLAGLLQGGLDRVGLEGSIFLQVCGDGCRGKQAVRANVLRRRKLLLPPEATIQGHCQ
mmetsp:Transcript_143137/g.372892  ORF Transcript_143137/g.372892 Transcript_143137/m.372892 type:complete len:202 (+) Transcript_143137:604-1209(+)